VGNYGRCGVPRMSRRRWPESLSEFSVPLLPNTHIDPVWSKYSNLLKPRVMALPAPNCLWKTLRAKFWTL
jgi:hypothetical protein